MKTQRYINYIISFLVAIFAVVVPTASARTALDFFKDSGAQTPLLDALTRLDMADYYTSNLEHTSTNSLEGRAMLLDVTNRTLRYQGGTDMQYELCILTAGRDTTLMLIETVQLPQADSRATFFDRNWNPLNRISAPAPSLADWLTADGAQHRADAERLLPFLLVDMTFDADTQALTLHHNMEQYFADDADRARVHQWLQPSLTYTFNGKTFKSTK